MNIASLIFEIDLEISRLQQARALLSGSGSSIQATRKRKSGRPPKSAVALKKVSRSFSAEGLARIRAAQKKRWAAAKKAAKN